MKVVLEKEGDSELINWPAVAESVKQAAAESIRKALERAGKELGELAPGEKRTFTIEIGTIEISRSEIVELT